jgi:putative transposase
MAGLLQELDAAGQRPAWPVRLAASSVELSERTMWRWLARARPTGEVTQPRRARFVAGEALRRLAYWRGNIAALHPKMVAAAARRRRASPPYTGRSPVTCRPGSAPGLRKGEHAARAFDVFMQRPATHRPSRRRSRSTSRGSLSGRQ